MLPERVHEAQKSECISQGFYNYEHFDAGCVGDFTRALKLGSEFPDAILFDTKGHLVSLGELTSERTVLVTGSSTCPQFVHGLPALIQEVRMHENVRLVALYVREAHPGESIRAHVNLAEKLAHARRLQEKFPELEYLLVDHMDGRTHSFFGNMPNACFLLDKSRRIIYRSSWLKLEDLQLILAGLLINPKSHAQNGITMASLPPMNFIWQTLNQAGRGAVLDVLRSLPALALNRSRLKRTLFEERPKGARSSDRWC